MTITSISTAMELLKDVRRAHTRTCSYQSFLQVDREDELLQLPLRGGKAIFTHTLLT